jgi:hypothetical protein
MNNYSKITEIIRPFKGSPKGLQADCIDKMFTDDTIIHSIKIGDKYINTRIYKKDENFKYKLNEICTLIKPKNIYDFALSLTLYNSQDVNTTAIEAYLSNKNNIAPKEYSYLLQETKGWILWEYQFINILRLFTLDRDLPNNILKDYKKDKKNIKNITDTWLIDNENIISSMERNMLQKGMIYRLILKLGKEISDAL